MSTVKRNELESFQAYCREPRSRRELVRCSGCGERLGGTYEKGEKCDYCLELESDLKKRQQELDQ